jgi:cellulose biosynthesis protein BcsQ
MSQKENTNTFIVCSSKGGVGATTLSEILAALLHREDITVTIYHPDSFNVIDDEPQNFKLVHIGTKSIQLQNFGKRINTDCIDFLFKKTKDINIIDLSKDSFELLQELGMGINYYIPITDNPIEIDLAIKTIEVINEFSIDSKIYLILNKCNSLNKNEIKKQFISLYGNKKLGIKSRINELTVDNIFYIPKSKIFSEFSLTKTNLLDYLKSNNQKNEAFNQEVEHFVQKIQDLKKSF